MQAEHLRTVEDPYADERKGREQGTTKSVPQEMTQRFCALLKAAVIGGAFSKQDSKTLVANFWRKVQENTPFRIDVEGESALRDADIILANHQGPRTDDVGGVDGAKASVDAGMGGTEGLYAHLLIPPHTRYVLKNYLISLGLGDIAMALLRLDRKKLSKALKQLLMALTFRRTNPIVVDRTLEKPDPESSELPPREQRILRRRKRERYVDRMRAERRRVAEEICKTIREDGKHVLIYPEGTRSNDGRLLGFVSEFFEKIVTDYILPRLQSGEHMKIGILVSDILSAFPDGVGRNVKAYEKPVTLKGIAYDPAAVLTALRQRTHGPDSTPLTQEEIKRYGRMLLMDARRQMAEALVGLLETREGNDSQKV